VAAEVSALSVYARRDGLVDSRACVDPRGEQVEVFSSHCGMADYPATLHVAVEWLHGSATSAL
jgi:triacylglycerol lipase